MKGTNPMAQPESNPGVVSSALLDDKKAAFTMEWDRVALALTERAVMEIRTFSLGSATVSSSASPIIPHPCMGNVPTLKPASQGTSQAPSTEPQSCLDAFQSKQTVSGSCGDLSANDKLSDRKDGQGTGEKAPPGSL